jgi:hypothetical protein
LYDIYDKLYGTLSCGTGDITKTKTKTYLYADSQDGEEQQSDGEPHLHAVADVGVSDEMVSIRQDFIPV